MISAKNLDFHIAPTELFPDWGKVSGLDWGAMGAGFQPVGVEDCGEGLLNQAYKDQIELKPIVITSTYSPLGRKLPKLRDDRIRRLSKRAGVKTEGELFGALTNQFPSVTLPVPKADFQKSRLKDHRSIPGYNRLNRYILLVPKGKNPYDDWLMLCLPDRVQWSRYFVGTCGKRVRRLTMIGYGGYDVVPGPFSPMKPTNSWVTLQNDVFGAGFQDATHRRTHPLWAKLEKRIRAMKRRARKLSPTAKPNNFAFYDWPSEAGERSRTTAEQRLLAKTYGR
ncbi:hypothetical protein [Shimia ponticola]|uniref:hypothetical protein n=1 Tax=Shimia ponticola TaxID=2582893 RepID=UPI0011BFA166|nr:hypothetical protein [Shimia ponticola]